MHWCRGDLLDGAGVGAAVEGADVVVHCATQPTGGRDVIAAGNLISAVREAGACRIVYVSIVGIDRIPLPYYTTNPRASCSP